MVWLRDLVANACIPANSAMIARLPFHLYSDRSEEKSSLAMREGSYDTFENGVQDFKSL